MLCTDRSGENLKLKKIKKREGVSKDCKGIETESAA